MTFREILKDYEARIDALKKENAELKRKLDEKNVEVPIKSVEVVCPSGKTYYTEPESTTIVLASDSEKHFFENIENPEEFPMAKAKRSRRKKDEPIEE